MNEMMWLAVSFAGTRIEDPEFRAAWRKFCQSRQIGDAEHAVQRADDASCTEDYRTNAQFLRLIACRVVDSLVAEERLTSALSSFNAISNSKEF